MAGKMIEGGWYDTHAPYCWHARINGRMYAVRYHLVECDFVTVTTVPDGSSLEPHEIQEAARRMAEQHAMLLDGKLEFGSNPAVVPETSSRDVG